MSRKLKKLSLNGLKLIEEEEREERLSFHFISSSFSLSSLNLSNSNISSESCKALVSNVYILDFIGKKRKKKRKKKLIMIESLFLSHLQTCSNVLETIFNCKFKRLKEFAYNDNPSLLPSHFCSSSLEVFIANNQVKERKKERKINKMKKDVGKNWIAESVFKWKHKIEFFLLPFLLLFHW